MISNALNMLGILPYTLTITENNKKTTLYKTQRGVKTVLAQFKGKYGTYVRTGTAPVFTYTFKAANLSINVINSKTTRNDN